MKNQDTINNKNPYQNILDILLLIISIISVLIIFYSIIFNYPKMEIEEYIKYELLNDIF